MVSGNDFVGLARMAIEMTVVLYKAQSYTALAAFTAHPRYNSGCSLSIWNSLNSPPRPFPSGMSTISSVGRLGFWPQQTNNSMHCGTKYEVHYGVL
jgi:hypothetical protein